MNELIKLLFDNFSPEVVIQNLIPFMTKARIERIDQVLSRRIHRVQIAVESPYDVHNGLAMVRTAEAMGVTHVHFIQALMKKGQGKGTTRGTMKWAHLKRHDTLEAFLQGQDEVLLAGACVDGKVSIENLPIEKPICFLFGNENTGLTDSAKKACDMLYHVPMYGMVESYNLSVTAALTLYDFLGRKRQSMGREGDLTPAEHLIEKAQYYIRSMGPEMARQILERTTSAHS